ncbi:MAG: hypoxanthine phosphoribosyltransferase [Bacteroidales bacterium]|nr:hypoxanthine phosphoribosyltransferase [Bacteroidales bacterium]
MGLKEVNILDKKFRELIPEQSLQERIDEMAARINFDFEGKEVVFVGILNGAFMFAADLFKRIDLKARITFIKLASYTGTSSSGAIKELIGWNEELKDKQVIIVEDIVDTGETLEYTVNNLIIRNVTDIKIASLLLKPESYRKNIKIDYVGYEIPNDFVVGYGLDYNGFGRNLPSVYTMIH